MQGNNFATMSAMKPLYLALSAMFVQQSFVMMAKVTTPIAAAVAFPALGVDATAVGIFVGFYSCCQIVIVMFSGNLIRRYGGLRISQIGLLSILIGMLAAITGSIWAFALTAIFVSFGVSVSTPASAQIIARYAPPKLAPLIFSAKQTAVPVGQIASGLLVPFLAALYGWQGAFVGVGLLCFSLAFLLEPTRKELDQDRDPHHPLSPSSIKGDIKFALQNPSLRMLVLMQGAFTGLWSVYVTYFVVFFIDRMHYSLSEAGAIFATATFIGLPGRMLWGYAAGRWMSSNAVLALLGFFTTFTVILTGFNSAAWPAWALLTVAVGVNIASTGWQGIALSEMARLSPPGKVGAVTGSIIGLSCIGQVIMPPMFAVVLWLTDSYALGFTLVAIPTSVVGVMMLVSDRRTVHEAK
jgi:MFS family permease